MDKHTLTLRQAAELGAKYLGKAVADGLMKGCAVSPERALRAINAALDADEKANAEELLTQQQSYDGISIHTALVEAARELLMACDEWPDMPDNVIRGMSALKAALAEEGE